MRKEISDGSKKVILDTAFHYKVCWLIKDIKMVNPKTGEIPNFILVDFLVNLRTIHQFFYSNKKKEIGSICRTLYKKLGE